MEEHPLFGRGICKWPECNALTDNYPAFLKHLEEVHTLDIKSLAQTRIQMQFVAQLELQLQKEKDLLAAMVRHLHGNRDVPSTSGTISEEASPGSSRPILDKSIEDEMEHNRELYKSSNVRPPFTYAFLIRQAIIESPEKQLTASEIYKWFHSTFGYFRRNPATWKNAVRHNLSIHKCFKKVKDEKGALWTVDDTEFHKRRSHRMHVTTRHKDLHKEVIVPKSPQLRTRSFDETLKSQLEDMMEKCNISYMFNEDHVASHIVDDLPSSHDDNEPEIFTEYDETLSHEVKAENLTSEIFEIENNIYEVTKMEASN